MKQYTAIVRGKKIVVDAAIMRRPRLHIRRGEAAEASAALGALKFVLRLLFRLFFRVRVEGMANVPGRPAIICFNHLGWSDVFLVLLFFPLEPRIYVVGLQHVSEVSGFRHWLIDKLQILIPIDPSKPFGALRISEGVLERGGSLLISPEGRLGQKEGELTPLQRGAAHAAVTCATALLPVGLTGTHELWLRRTLTVRIGKPIDPAGFPGDTRTRVRDMTAELERSMRALLPGDHEQPRFKLLRNWLTNLFKCRVTKRESKWKWGHSKVWADQALGQTAILIERFVP